jgi:hypothetical protein
MNWKWERQIHPNICEISFSVWIFASWTRLIRTFGSKMENYGKLVEIKKCSICAAKYFLIRFVLYLPSYCWFSYSIRQRDRENSCTRAERFTWGWRKAIASQVHMTDLKVQYYQAQFWFSLPNFHFAENVHVTESFLQWKFILPKIRLNESL